MGHEVSYFACPYCFEPMPILTGANRKLWERTGEYTCEHWEKGKLIAGCGRTYTESIEVVDKPERTQHERKGEKGKGFDNAISG